ncbi:clostripain-related cysteine peptidase [Candidatus Dependentiae bacterium]
MKGLFKKATIKTLLFIFIATLFHSFLHGTSAPIKTDTDIIEHINNLLETTREEVYDAQDVPILKHATKVTQPKKPWTLMIYIAADNDLRSFAVRNLKQMAKIGSNKNLNIIVHLDIKLTGNKKTTKRYYVQKDKILHLNANDPRTQRMDSGNPETLISFCKWGITEFPAENYGLILWNHGTGALDPRRGRILKLSELFTFNPQINKVEVDRSIGFFDLLNACQLEDRGICWDDTTGNYLTNHNLDYALGKIYTKILGEKKFAFIGFDACLMQMTEVISIVKKYADIMIASQEVILGTGWNYIETLKPFLRGSLTKEEFAKHIVYSYKKSYERITNDLTLSALTLNEFDLVEENINHVSNLLVQCLKKQKNRSVRKAIATSRSRLLCTHFDEPSFIDLHHLYKNILASLKHFVLHNKKEEKRLKTELQKALAVGCKIIEKITLANVVGKNLPKAKGVSIYFPKTRIYFSYRKLEFCKNNDWIVFLTQYLNV